MQKFSLFQAIFLASLSLAACKGPAGPAGEPGVAGEKGDKGDKGKVGDAGANGSNGSNGQAGEDGEDAVVDPLLSPLDKALVGIGGQTAIETLNSFSLDITGTNGIAYEGYTPETFYPAITAFTTTVNADLAGDAWLFDVTRDNYFFGLPVAQAFEEVLSGDVGEIVGTESILGFPSVMPSDRWSSIQRNQRLINPHLLLKEVAADPLLATDGGVALLDGSVHHLLVIADEVAPITLWVNASTGAIAKLSTTENDPTFSDVPVEVFYYGWAPSTGDLFFPTQVYVAVDGQIIHSETRTVVPAVNFGFAAGFFDLTTTPVPFDETLAQRGAQNAQFHQQFAGIGIPVDGLQTAVVPTELTPGVWHITGGSHNSMLVEQDNGLVLFDAPLYPELGELIIDWAVTQFPTKAITHVVVSHFHRDHVGGLRALIANGATLVVHESAQGFYEDLAARPRTIQPDTLSGSPVTPSFLLVPDGGSLTLADATRPVDVYSITNTHAQDLVIPYVQNEQVAFTVDVYSPGLGVTPAGLEVYDGLTTQHALTVSTLAGGHGAMQTWDGFVTELTDAGFLP